MAASMNQMKPNQNPEITSTTDNMSMPDVIGSLGFSDGIGNNEPPAIEVNSMLDSLVQNALAVLNFETDGISPCFVELNFEENMAYTVSEDNDDILEEHLEGIDTLFENIFKPVEPILPQDGNDGNEIIPKNNSSKCLDEEQSRCILGPFEDYEIVDESKEQYDTLFTDYYPPNNSSVLMLAHFSGDEPSCVVSNELQDDTLGFFAIENNVPLENEGQEDFNLLFQDFFDSIQADNQKDLVSTEQTPSPKENSPSVNETPINSIENGYIPDESPENLELLFNNILVDTESYKNMMKNSRDAMSYSDNMPVPISFINGLSRERNQQMMMSGNEPASELNCANYDDLRNFNFGENDTSINEHGYDSLIQDIFESIDDDKKTASSTSTTTTTTTTTLPNKSRVVTTKCTNVATFYIPMECHKKTITGMSEKVTEVVPYQIQIDYDIPVDVVYTTHDSFVQKENANILSQYNSILDTIEGLPYLTSTNPPVDAALNNQIVNNQVMDEVYLPEQEIRAKYFSHMRRIRKASQITAKTTVNGSKMAANGRVLVDRRQKSNICEKIGILKSRRIPILNHPSRQSIGDDNPEDIVELPIVVDKNEPVCTEDQNYANFEFMPKKPSKAGRKPNPNSKRSLDLAMKRMILKQNDRIPLEPLTQDDMDEMRRLSCLSMNGMSLEIKRLQDEAAELSKIEARELARAKHLKILYYYRRRKRKPNVPPKKYNKKKKNDEDDFMM